MSSFRFQLANVVMLRERERDAAAHAYKQALAAIDALDKQVEELQTERQAQTPWRQSSVLEEVNPQRLLEVQRYQSHLSQEIAGIQSKIELVKTEAEKRRMKLVQREQAVSSLEKLKEKQLQAWHAAQLQSQQITLDEWSGYKFWKERAAAATPTEHNPAANHFTANQPAGE